MKRILPFLLLPLLLSVMVARAQLLQPILMGTPSAGGGGGCAQATTFIARTSGENSSALTTAICGMVTDGLIDSNASMASTGGNPYCGATGKFGGLYILAMANSTDALLDACGHASLASTGSPTFTANHGFAGSEGSGSGVYLDTGFNPSTAGGLYSLNSAHLAAWVLDNSLSSSNPVMGASTATAVVYIWPTDGDGDHSAYFRVNTLSHAALSGAVTASDGLWISNRVSSGGEIAYLNGSVFAGTDSSASEALPTENLFVLGSDHGGGTVAGSSHQIAAASFGPGLSGTDAGNLYSRLNTYLTAVGAH